MKNIQLLLKVLMLNILLIDYNIDASPHVRIEDDNDIKNQVDSIVWHSLLDNKYWGYTVESTLDTGRGKVQQRIQSFTPNAPLEEQWQLIEHQYEVPSPQMLNEYSETMTSVMNSEQELELRNIQVINLSTLRFETSTESHLIYSFQPTLPMFDEGSSSNFAGQLFVSKNTNELDYLTILMTEPFSPSLTVKLNKYELFIDLEKNDDFFHVSEVTSHKAGRLLLFSAFNEKSKRIFTDIHYVH